MPRRAFAKPAVLVTIVGLVAGAVAAIFPCFATRCRGCAARRPPGTVTEPSGLYRDEGGRQVYVGPATACPQHQIPLADGRLVDLVDLRPGTRVYDGCDMRGADWAGVNLTRVMLVGVDFRSASLRGACFRGANLIGANLAGADLRGADLSGAALYMTEDEEPICLPNLQGARYDRHTRWPEGFRPEEHGARLVK
jgi:Pentapeptide repeats (8 copies)